MKTKIYLLPGLMCDERLWSRLVLYFDDTYEFIPLSIPLLDSFDEICEYISGSVKDEKINLLGFSLGGYIASYFALKYPNRVQRLFIIAATICSLSKGEIKKRNETLKLIDNYGFKGLSSKKVISLLLKENQEDTELISLIQEMYIDLGEEALKSQMASTLHRKNLLTNLLTLSIPLTYSYSTKDRLLNYNWIEEFILLHKTCKVVSIEGSSHMLPLEKPLELSEEIKNWAQTICI